MARTNIEIDDELIALVMKQSGKTTKKDAVDYALRRAAVTPMTREQMLAMEGARLLRDDFDLDEVRGTIEPPVR
jgi:Arc/MetJ family transcription regulator